MNNNNDRNDKRGFNRGGYKGDNGGYNKDNRNSGFKRDGGGYNRDNRDNRDNKGEYKPGGYKGASGGYNRDNRDNRGEYKPGGFKRDGGSYNRDNKDNRFGRNDGERRFDKDRKFDKPYKSDRFDKKDNRDNRYNKFDKKPANFNKFDKKVNNRTFTEDNNIKAIASVEDENSGMIYGRNAVIELLKSNKTVDKVYVQSGQREGSITLIVAEAIKKSIPVIEADKPKLDAMINNSAHQGVIALASEKDYCSIDDILAVAEERGEKPFIIVADKIMDPHNLGAIIRTAECAGVHGLIIPKRNAAGISPIVTKTSAGASVHMAVAKVTNIATALEELKEKGVWIFASTVEENTENSENIVQYYEADYTLSAAVVVGNEGEGLAPIIIKNSDFLVRIPMFGKLESLNVSCASAVILYEAAKQRVKV